MTNKWKDGLPPVGEECEITVLDTDGLFRNCKILYIDSMSVVFSSSAASSMPKYLSEVKFRPLRTPVEVERERVVKIAQGIKEANPASELLECLYDAGLLHDKKVKPVSYESFETLYHTHNHHCSLYGALMHYGYIIGADE